MNYAPRITLPYADVSGIVEIWSTLCNQMVVYEHEADDEIKQTHVHMIMIGCTRKQKSLCERFYKELPHEVRKGNALWSWEHKEFPNPQLEYIVYMSKGRLEPKFVKGVFPEQIARFKEEWHNRSVHKNLERSDIMGALAPAAGEASGGKPKYDEWDHLRKDGLVYFRDKRHSFDSVRSWVMSWYWRRDGRLPNPPVYKRNAASLHLHLSEVKEESSPNEYSFQCALEEIKNLWY